MNFGGGDGYNVFYKTIDSGQSWMRQNTSADSAYYFDRFRFLNEQTGYAYKFHQVYKTQNSGRTWEPLTMQVVTPADPDIPGLMDLQFLSASQFWVGGNQQMFISTNVGGTVKVSGNLNKMVLVIQRIETGGTSNAIQLCNLSSGIYLLDFEDGTVRKIV